MTWHKIPALPPDPKRVFTRLQEVVGQPLAEAAETLRDANSALLTVLPKGVVGLVLLIRTRDELPMFSSTIPEAEVVKHLRELADTIEKRLS
jgi:hypothetical protein